ncbi:MAG: NAD-dependent deacylase [Rhodospirillaceae bacterium]|nr:NAD-dependent deacylase [Rhodospirillaceae bacterium]
MRVVILTGAGISAESGLGTFRDKGGVWSSHDLAEVATPEGFARDPGKVHDFYNTRRLNMRTAEPNAAHLALGRLERELEGEAVIVTQNIDDLHERAGSRNVLHMHGKIGTALCNICSHRWDAPDRMLPADLCPACGRAATRPDVVWFGEIPHHLDRIDGLLGAADIFAAIGTSGQVHPAAGFVQVAAACGGRTIELNLEPSEISRHFDEVRLGPATEIVPEWVSGLLDGA